MGNNGLTQNLSSALHAASADQFHAWQQRQLPTNSDVESLLELELPARQVE